MDRSEKSFRKKKSSQISGEHVTGTYWTLPASQKGDSNERGGIAGARLASEALSV